MKRLSFYLVLILIAIVPVFSQGIFEAVWDNDLDRVKKLIKENPALLHYKSNEGYSPLHSAARMGLKDIVKFFIEKETDINTANLWGTTPLHYACEWGRAEVVEILIQSGADINVKDKKGWTPLRRAVHHGNIEITELLLEKGAEFNFDEHEYNSLLHEAADSGYEKLVNMILDKKADIYSLNKRGGTLLHSAVYGGLKNLTEFLLKKDFNVEEKNDYGMTPLHIAAFRGNKNVVEFLILKGAEVNAVDFGGRTPRYYAKDQGNKEIDSLLLSKGALAKTVSFPELRGPYMGQKKPGKKAEIFAPGIVSTLDANEFSGTISPDAEEFFYTYRKPGGVNSLRHSKVENGRWIIPVSPPFAYDAFEFETNFSPDGKRIYYSSERPAPIEDQRKNVPYGWVVEKIDGKWREPEFLGPSINNELPYYITQALNGNLYFTGNRQRGVYMSIFKDGHYQTPERLPDEINHLFNPGHPFIAPDESFVIFDARDGRKNSDDTDLYMSYRKPDGSWIKAVNMGPAVNSDANEMCASISPDGKFLFFHSARFGNADIYWIDAKFIDELKTAGIPDIIFSRDEIK